MGIILINIISLLINRNRIGICLLSSFLLGGEIFPLVNFVIVIILGRKSIKFHKPPITYILLVFFIFTVSFINSLYFETTINFAVYSLYLLMIVVSAVYCRGKVSEDDIVFCIKKFVAIQFVIVVIIALTNNTVVPGDVFIGSLENAHWFGNWVLVNIAAFYYINKCKYSLSCTDVVKKDWELYIIALVEIYLADAKVLVVAMIAGIMLYKVSEKIFRQKNSYFYCFVVLFLFLFVFSVSFQSDYAVNLINSIIPEYARYLYSSEFNGKILYITGTFSNELSDFRLFTGFGLGQYGSRVANLFAYNQMWRAENAINAFISSNFDPAYIKSYVQYIWYYDNDFVKEIWWKSAILSYPFNSITALIAETGIIGVIGVAKVINDVIKPSGCRFLAYYFMIACMFDIFFDNFPFVMLIIVMILNTCNSENYYKSEDDKR